MKFSLNSIREMNKRYGCADDVAAIGIDALVARIGAQLGAVEEVIDLGSRYQGIVIADVIACEPHPDADKLQVCTIDDGGVVKDVERDAEGHVLVVCGAPNVRRGITVAWLPPGTTVPETVGKEPFVLEARPLRGVVSNGMFASARELGLGDSHDGILEVGTGYKAGTDFAEAFGLKEDVIIDIENKMFTHRPDCFGFLGVSRELAGIQDMPFKSPDWYRLKPEFPAAEGDQLPLQVRNDLPELVPRFSALTMSNITVGPSPVWLQVELAKIGQKSINNIVDYTNFFMLETGQPLHAYDYDKVKARSSGEAAIVIRHPQAGEKIALLNGKTIEPRPEAIMIATDQALIGLGGVMGGSDTEVDATTKNIILEAANFNMYSIRRTSMAHGLFTDAVTRFNKGQSPLQNLATLAKIVDEIKRYVGGKVAGELIDDRHFEARDSVYPPVKLSAQFINARLGSELSDAEITRLLSNVEFTATAADGQLEVTAPFWRTDIELPEDIVEEVGRLYGYDHLPLVLPRRDIAPTAQDRLLRLRTDIRQRLARAGANEVLTYSFVPGDLLRKVGQDAGQAFQISNALSPDLQYYRLSLLPSLLDKVHANIKAGYEQFALFQLGKSHQIDQLDSDGLPFEFERTALVFAANNQLKKAGAAFYEAREFLQALADIDLEYKPLLEDAKRSALTAPFNTDRAALVCLPGGGEVIGVVGEFKPSVSRALKLPDYCAGFEVDTVLLGEAMATQHGYRPLSRFPKVSQDITFKVPVTLTYQELFSFVDKHIEKTQPADSVMSLQPLDIYQKPDDIEHKQITLRLELANYSRTLTDKEVNKLLDGVAVAAAKLGASRV